MHPTTVNFLFARQKLNLLRKKKEVSGSIPYGTKETNSPQKPRGKTPKHN